MQAFQSLATHILIHQLYCFLLHLHVNFLGDLKLATRDSSVVSDHETTDVAYTPPQTPDVEVNKKPSETMTPHCASKESAMPKKGKSCRLVPERECKKTVSYAEIDSEDPFTRSTWELDTRLPRN